MAALAGDLSRAILTQTEAAKTFRPWWDIVEDGLLYSLVLLSLISLPMTFFSGNPVACAIHRDYWMFNTTNSVPKQTRFIQSYAKKYCTETHLSIFFLYLPITIMLVPLTLTAVEKFFIKIFSTEKKLDIFFKMLVEKSLNTEDVGNLESNNIKEIHEIRQAFRNSANCYKSYLYRTIFELMVNMVLFILYVRHRDEYGFMNPFFDCSVHTTTFECVIPNSKFFFIILLLTLIIMIAYFCCSAFNLVWIISRRARRLRRFLLGMKKEISRSGDHNSVLASSLVIYMDNKSPDFGMLMDLLAECDGISQSLRILTIFDRQFREGWVPQNCEIKPLGQFEGIDIELAEEGSISVSWDDCSLADFATRHLGKSILEYTVEIQIAADSSQEKSAKTTFAEAAIKSFQYFRLDRKVPELNLESDLKPLKPKQNGIGPESSHLITNMEESLFLKHDIIKLEFKSSGKYQTRFDGLQQGMEYNLVISTEIDGQTITQSMFSYKYQTSDKISSESEKTKETDKKD